MNVWIVEFKRRENTLWDFILPVGFSLFVYFSLQAFYIKVMNILGLQFSRRLLSILGIVFILAIMLFLTIYLSRTQRVFVFPLFYLISLVMMALDIKLYLVFLALAISGMGYTAVNIALVMLFGESQNISTKNILAPIVIGAILGTVGGILTLITYVLVSLLFLFAPFLPPLWTGLFFDKLYGNEPWANEAFTLNYSILDINTVLWFFIFFVLGVAAVRIWRKLKETSNGKLSIREREGVS